MKVDPLFTIITPVYNRADCIKRCIDSVISQTFDSYELIIINDGSTDETLNIIESFEHGITNVRIINYAENKGVNYARNRGIEQAKGNFIIFLDSDDYLAKNALRIIDEAIRQHPGYDHYLFGVISNVDNNMVPNTVHEYSYADWLSENVSGDFAHVIKTSCFDNLMFVEKFRIYERLNWMRVLRKNNVQLFIPAVVLLIERDRPDSVSREHLLNNSRSMHNTYNFFYQYIEWYSKDFYALGLERKLQAYIDKAIFLGFALGESYRNENLIALIKNNEIKKIGLKIINKFFPNFFFYNLILFSSFYGQFKRKCLSLFHSGNN